MLNPFQKNLNQAQTDAANHTSGPALIVAGAGTGKTTVLIERLNFLFESKLAEPSEVLCLTFTEKGAGEMEDRALKILPMGYVELWISTFHGFCERILRERALDIGLSPDFKLLTQTEQWILIKKNLDKFDLKYYKPLGNPNKFIYELTKHFSRLKDENISDEEYLEYTLNQKLTETKEDSSLVVPAPLVVPAEAGIQESKGSSSSLSTSKLDNKNEQDRIKELAHAYKIYNQLLLNNEKLDFGDLIFYTIKLFKERPAILDFYREKFKFIMIDEFQDTNWAQYELIKILSAPKNNLMVVGDDDQAIYKFRGASLSNILQFKDDFPDAKEVILNKNYRSGQKILDAAYSLIQNNNPNRLEVKLEIDKNLISETSFEGIVKHINLEAQADEFSFVIQRIKELFTGGTKENPVSWSDFAILVRANSAAESFTTELTRAGIPNTFVSLKGLYYKPLILDLIAYFKLLDNYHESASVFRVLNMEVFFVEPGEIISFNRFARSKALSLFEALGATESIPGISQKAKESINLFLELVKKHSLLAKSAKPSKIFLAFLNDTGLLKNKDFDIDREFFSLINQFYQKIKRFEEDSGDMRLKDFMDLLDLEMEAGETGSLKLDYGDDDTVKILTVHAAKGLEFKYVFLPGLVDKKFPTITRQEKIGLPDSLVREKLPQGKELHLEEERRLFYVALTRAKEELYLLSAKDYGGVREKKPSVFIAETGCLAENTVPAVFKKNELIRDLEDFLSPLAKPLPSYYPPVRYSFSQLEAFSNCPLQYKFNFILGVPIPSKPVFIFGRVMHSTLRDFMATFQILNNGQTSLFSNPVNRVAPSLSMLEGLFDKHWQNDGYDSAVQRDEYHQAGYDALRLFFEHNQEFGWPNVQFLEKTFLTKVGGYVFRGAIDRVDRLPDGTFEIIDYKTGESKDKLDFDTKKQLMLYQIALEEGMGLKVSALSYYYLRSGDKLSFVAKPTEVDKLKEGMIRGVEEINKGHFPPRPSILCGYCDFNGICEYRQ